jgi:hypothetical protein
MSKGPAHVPGVDKIRESWVVNLITRASLAIGTPIYVLYNPDEGNDCRQRGGFKGDIRIAKKVGTIKKDTMFAYKDGNPKSVATVDVKTLIDNCFQKNGTC